MNKIILFSLFSIFSLTISNAQTISDDFEGNGNILTWFADNCGMDTNFVNPYQSGMNLSSKVMKYSDNGSPYGNVRFDINPNFNLSSNNIFSLKIYVPSAGLTGNQNNQISLKLQNNTLAEPWTTQCEIIKPIVLNQWQTVTFNFETDAYINLNSSSPAPNSRLDFNRVLLQINGENNTNLVTAYIDDFLYENVNQFSNLVWSDEFSANGAINSLNWHHQTQLIAGSSWANGEIQHYTNRQVNSFVSNGFLNIVAKKETFTDQGQTKQYTSARLNSKFAFKYGRVEVRAKLPAGAGTFPAIWMLGKNIIEPGGYWSTTNGTVNWPTCGEMDIMEHWGTNQNFVQSATHTPSSFGNTVNLGGQIISTVSSDFHIYALEWNAQKLVFSVDNMVQFVYNPTVKNASTWPFDAPQYILLNAAILPSITNNFTQSTMEIDYVRVYQQSPLVIENQMKSSVFQIYPNPTNDKIIIQFTDKQQNAKLKISSVLGQELKYLEFNQQKNPIDISDFLKGIYLFEIQTGNNFETFKIIKN
ncbi:MAG: family 16 glycosylhydrolase [Flavobacterium sp.]|nr:family 16 glycosylhydrolase [Flavobacterium sp.]